MDPAKRAYKDEIMNQIKNNAERARNDYIINRENDIRNQKLYAKKMDQFTMSFKQSPNKECTMPQSPVPKNNKIVRERQRLQNMHDDIAEQIRLIQVHRDKN